MTKEGGRALCDIGQASPPDHHARRVREIEALVAAGYLERAGDHSLATYLLTGKAQNELAARGVGLNEA